ncbi:MAG: NUDIX hydrolase [Candidatus Gastranaerophilales bacterium]|nr:NUDIX hydrolase [Candidatus Gastranaerophilales bacterium]
MKKLNDVSSLSLEEKTLSSELKYEGHIVNIRQDDVLLSNGEEHFREVVEHPGGVVIIPVIDNKVILVKQWRHPVKNELIEFPAGKLNKGEDPFLAAQRELTEETGYIAKKWESLGFIYTAPGFCDEKLYLYKATDLEFSETNPDFGEIVEPFEVEINHAMEMIKDGRILDAKTIIGLSLLKIQGL